MMRIVRKRWGYELILVNTELYSCKLMVVKGGYQCSIHHHKLKDETFVMLAGDVTLTDHEGLVWPLKMLETYRIRPLQKHSFAGYSLYSLVLEVATADLPDDSYRENESGRI